MPNFHPLTVVAVALTEGVAKLVLSQSLVATVRPKQYFTIPREALESALGDVEQLINFFVIEFQRVLFAENVLVTFAVSLLRLPLFRFANFCGASHSSLPSLATCSSRSRPSGAYAS